MKKKLFFSLLILTLAFFITLSPSKIFAETNVSVNISVDGNYSDNYDEKSYIYSSEYSVFSQYSSLTFIASPSTTLTNATYEWKTNNGDVICNNSHLKLYKTITDASISNITTGDINNSLILVGTSKYKVTITGTLNGEPVETSQTISVVITGNEETYSISSYTAFDYSSTIVTKNTDDINLYAFLATTKNHTIDWYFKAPNSVSYNLISSNTNNYIFSPAELITDTNGYGEYKFYAKAKEKTSSAKTHYSDVFNFVVVSATPSKQMHAYTILSNETKNSKARIQAFVYSVQENLQSEEISSASVLDGNRIIWYINNSAVGTGKTFKYEPTSTDIYDVTAKYINYDNTITELATYREQPASTGLGILLLYIAIAVVALGAILTISIIVSNKKRDVVW